MDRIGSYIHYRYRNYMMNGTGVTPPGRNDMIDVLKGHQTAMKNLVRPRSAKARAAIKKDLENQLNFFFGAKTSLDSMGYTTEQQQKIRNEVEKLFREKMAQLKPNLNLDDIDFNTLSVKKNNSLIETIDPIAQTSYGKLGSTQTYTWTDAIERRLYKLNEMINNIKLDETMSMDIINEVQRLEKNYAQLKLEIEANSKTETKSGRRMFRISGENSSARKTFIDELNLAIVGTKEKYAQQLLGYLGEYIPAITQSVLQSYAVGKTAELMADFDRTVRVVGGHQYSTKKILDPTKFLGGDLVNGSGKQYALAIGNINAKTNYTQDKVDLMLDIPGTNKKIAASAKNYNFNLAKRGIHLHSGTSLLKMLQNYPTFTNHYANITAAHPAKDDEKPRSIDVAEAHRLMKLTIAAHSLAGGLLGERKSDGTIVKSKKAEILLVNDNSSKRGFRVYFVSDLIDKIIKNIELITIDGYNNPTWDNKWVSNGSTGREGKSVEAGFRRSMNVIAQMHKMKISVSISPTVFT